MTIWFADTSALIKRYVREPGSDWLRHEIGRNEVVIAQITPIELSAALGRRFQQGIISRFAFYQARRMFLLHLNAGKYSLFNLNQRIINESMRLTFHRGLRAYDALQLATALVARETFRQRDLVFLTADVALEAVARTESFVTANPLTRE